MKILKTHQFLATIVLSLSVMLSVTLTGCGGAGDTAIKFDTKQISGPPPSATPAAPASSTFVVAGMRNNYTMKRTSTGFLLSDKGFAGGTIAVPATQTSVKFSDLAVNLLVGDKSKTITASRLANLIELYIAFFNRVPDADGMSYWIDQIKAGMTVDQMSSSFYDAAIQYSSVTGYSASMTNADFVKVIYKNVLGRVGPLAPTDVEVNYWVNELSSGKSTKGALIATMLTSARAYANDAQWGWVAKLLDNKVTVGNYISIQQGLTYNTPEESITMGIAIAAAVTDQDIKAAKDKIGVTDVTFDLTIAAPLPLPQVTINTSAGNIVVELDTVNAPITAANFLRYTDVGFYSNKIFHRVISNFMIQGGGFNSDLVQASTYSPIKLEVNKGLSNVRGTIAMARTSVLDSATSQFFINVVDNVFLDTSGGGYAVFGKVISGMDVVDKIKVVPTSTRGAFGDVPVNTVLINSVTRSN